MEQIDPQEIRRQHSALMKAWRRWEEDAMQAPTLRTALKETAAKLQACPQGHAGDKHNDNSYAKVWPRVQRYLQPQ
jgi:hypothetical protein